MGIPLSSDEVCIVPSKPTRRNVLKVKFAYFWEDGVDRSGW